MFQDFVRRQGHSADLYFTDLRAAFHAVVREFLVRLPAATDDLEEDIDELQLPFPLEAAMRNILAEPTVFERIGDPRTHDLIADVNSCAWFQVKGTPEVARASTGTRPGMPPADLFLTLAFAPVHEALRQ